MSMPRFARWAIQAGVLAILAASASAQTTVSITAARDNTLYEDPQGDVSNGQGPDIFAGTNQVPTIRRAVLKFNLNTVPPGSVVTAATLRLNVNRVRGGSHAVTVHKLLADWGEGPSAAFTNTGMGVPAAYGDATWLHTFYDADFWSTPGGDFVAAPSATTQIGGLGNFTWSGPGMQADVQSWLNDPSSNFGWIVRSVENTVATVKRFSSSEASNSSDRPQLTITYTPPNSPTGACCLPNGSCTVLSEFYCALQNGAYMGDSTSCAPSPCGQTTVQIVASKDNTIYEGGDLSNGAGDGVIVGTTDARRRGLVAFDLSSLPAASRVVSAELRLTQNLTADTQPRALSLHRLNSLWGEGASVAGGDQFAGAPAAAGDATWSYRHFNTDAWLNAGGDFDPAASAVALAPAADGIVTWSGALLAADVQNWKTTPASNRGWAIIGEEAAAGSARRFASREAAMTSARPTLQVTYTLQPLAAACCFDDGSCIVLTQSACAIQGGVFNEDQPSCTPNPCPQPIGACCLPLGNCMQLSAIDCTAAGGTFIGASASCVGASCRMTLTPFVDELPIPAVAQPTTGEPGGAAHYDIAMTEFLHQVHRDLPPTRVWGYGGTFPGPTIEARTDQPVTVTWINDLRAIESGELRAAHPLTVDECLHGPDMTGETPVTVVHLHGAKTTTDSDGHPDLTFPPGGQSELYTYPNQQRAATMWYHDHALGLTRLNVYMGLAGFYLLRDNVESALALPTGEYEVPLVIQDRSFNPDGSLRYHTDRWHEHFFGEFLVVNGKVWPYMNVKRGKYRFRVLNGSNSRTYTLSLSSGASFRVIGTEGGLLQAPVNAPEFTIQPGERVDVVIDFAPYAAGTEIVLTNSAPAPFPGGPEDSEIPQVMKFIVGSETGHTTPLPATLAPYTPIPEAESLRQRELQLVKMPAHANCPDHTEGVWMVNGLMWDDITEVPRIGQTEIWAWINNSEITHPMHIHLVQFQVLDRQSYVMIGQSVVPFGPKFPPEPWEAGWKDTAQSPPSMITRVIMRFEGEPGLYPYHCHLLEHEDHEMMRQFHLLCPADFNRDGVVNVPDIFAFLSAWFAYNPEADFNNNGVVFTTDIFAFLSAWFAPCQP